MDPNAYNARVDFINNASRQLEGKLAEENQKLHNFLRADINNKTATAQNVNNLIKTFDFNNYFRTIIRQPKCIMKQNQSQRAFHWTIPITKHCLSMANKR